MSGDVAKACARIRRRGGQICHPRFPLESIHTLARKATEAFVPTNRKGQEMRERLFVINSGYGGGGRHAQAIGLEASAFQAAWTTANTLR
jgi:hypothetical protein